MSILSRLFIVYLLMFLMSFLGLSCQPQGSSSDKNSTGSTTTDDDDSSSSTSDDDDDDDDTTTTSGGGSSSDSIETICGVSFDSSKSENSEDDDEDDDDIDDDDESSSIATKIEDCHEQGGVYFLGKGCNSGCKVVDSWCTQDKYSQKLSDNMINTITQYLSDGFEVESCFESDANYVGVSFIQSSDDGSYEQKVIYRQIK